MCIMQIINRVIQDIALWFDELDHLPQRLHRQHFRVAKRINLQSSHKGELLQLESRFTFGRSLPIGAKGDDG